MYPVINALLNIRRQYKRYRILAVLILICAMLTGVFMTIAVPCRLYSDQVNTVIYEYTDEQAMLHKEQSDRVRNLGESASLIQFSVMLVGAIAVLYVSSLMIRERMFDVGILYSVGLSKGQIFVSLFVELFTLCGGTLSVGIITGRILAVLYLKRQILQQILPAELLQFMGNGSVELLCLTAAVGILLMPILQLTVKLMHTDPCGFLRDRK